MEEIEGEEKEEETGKKQIFHYPLVKRSDMQEEMQTEAMDLCVTACEKYTNLEEKYTNNEAAAKMIKEAMDKKYGAAWHAVVGESFGMEISYEVQNLLYMFVAGTTAVCVWKCS